MYVKYATGEEELYESERADPLELINLVSRRPPTLLALRAGRGCCAAGNVYPPDWPF